MKATETCPKCRSRHLFVVKEVANEHPEYTRLIPLPVAAAIVPTGGGLLGGSEKVALAGHFEAWVCQRCGFTEWYAMKLAALAALAATSSAVRVIEREDEDGPYR